MNGIPVLSSNRGGPRYDNLVDERCRIDEIDDIDRWISRLRELLANYDAEAEAVAARDFSFCDLKHNINHFLELLEQVVELPEGVPYHGPQTVLKIKSTECPTT